MKSPKNKYKTFRVKFLCPNEMTLRHILVIVGLSLGTLAIVGVVAGIILPITLANRDTSNVV